VTPPGRTPRVCGEVPLVPRMPQVLPLPAQLLRPGLVRRPSVRALAFAVAGVAFLGLAYLVARETSLFAVSRLEVTGAPQAVRRDVEGAAAPLIGESLVGLDGSALQKKLEALPTVRSAHVDRAFPHTLDIAVVPERPVAVLRRGDDAWLVSERGHVIAAVDEDARPGLPRIRPDGESAAAPGAVLEGTESEHALAAVAAMPRAFARRVRVIRTRAGSITLALREGPDLRLGSPDELPLKIAVGAALLRSLSEDESDALGYLDVSVPERPVGGQESQVSGRD
jgi:cell division protein FtsQ